MADLVPFRALRYHTPDGDLSAVIAPPYDVISAAQQESLYERSPHNVVRLEYSRAPIEQRYDAVAREPMFTYDAGGVLHTVYYADGASIAERLGMYRARGFGMGVWRLGREDGALWSNAVVWP